MNESAPVEIRLLKHAGKTHLNVRRQFLLFLAVGAFAALVNFLTRIVFSHWFIFSVAIVLAYVCGIVTAFVLNRLLIFREASNPLRHQMLWFFAVNVVAIVQTLLVSLLLADSLFPLLAMHWHPETIAHAIGVAVPVGTSYIGHKKFSFKSP